MPLSGGIKNEKKNLDLFLNSTCIIRKYMLYF